MNTKMKVLSLALIGAFGYVGSAAAGTCPAGPTIPDGGAWTAAVSTAGTVAIGTPGYAGTSCLFNASLTGNLGSAGAYVRDDTPVGEMRYRAQFLVNVEALTGLTSAQNVRVFSANTAAPANGVPDVARLTVFGNAAGTSKILGVATACSTNPTGRCATSIPLSGDTAGVHTIEIDWQNGATGYLKVWVNNNVEASPNSDQPVDSAAWGGVDTASLGLATASPGFRAAQLTRVVSFDQFDSRRQTFIGF